MKPITIPEIEIEIGENLYLQISDLTFTPFKPGYISGPPEDCYEDEPAECNWSDKNVKLFFTDIEYDYPKDLADVYYDDIINKCEEYLNEQSNF